MPVETFSSYPPQDGVRRIQETFIRGDLAPWFADKKDRIQLGCATLTK